MRGLPESPLPFGVFRLRLPRIDGAADYILDGHVSIAFRRFPSPALPGDRLHVSRLGRGVSIAFRRFPSPALEEARVEAELKAIWSPLPFGVFRLRLAGISADCSGLVLRSLHCLSAFSVSGSFAERLQARPIRQCVSIAFRRFPSPAPESECLEACDQAELSPLPFGVFRLRLCGRYPANLCSQCREVSIAFRRFPSPAQENTYVKTIN